MSETIGNQKRSGRGRGRYQRGIEGHAGDEFADLSRLCRTGSG